MIARAFFVRSNFFSAESCSRTRSAHTQLPPLVGGVVVSLTLLLIECFAVFLGLSTFPFGFVESSAGYWLLLVAGRTNSTSWKLRFLDI